MASSQRSMWYVATAIAPVVAAMQMVPTPFVMAPTPVVAAMQMVPTPFAVAPTPVVDPSHPSHTCNPCPPSQATMRAQHVSPVRAGSPRRSRGNCWSRVQHCAMPTVPTPFAVAPTPVVATTVPTPFAMAPTPVVATSPSEPNRSMKTMPATSRMMAMARIWWPW